MKQIHSFTLRCGGCTPDPFDFAQGRLFGTEVPLDDAAGKGTVFKLSHYRPERELRPFYSKCCRYELRGMADGHAAVVYANHRKDMSMALAK